MKKLVLALCAVSAFTFQSCMKEYNCTCSSGSGSVKAGTMKAATKQEADRACKVLYGDLCSAER